MPVIVVSLVVFVFVAFKVPDTEGALVVDALTVPVIVVLLVVFVSVALKVPDIEGALLVDALIAPSIVVLAFVIALPLKLRLFPSGTII